MDRALGELAASLSERESQLLNLAAQGFTDNAISYKLGISLATVGTYWGRVRIKFGPLNRTELVAKYLNEQAEINLEQLRDENKQLLDELNDKANTVDVLRTSLDLFRGLIETAPDAILLVSEDGRIELANEQAEELFGYSRDELLGMSLEHLVPERFREEHPKHREEYHNNPIKRRMAEHLATYALRKDGSEFLMATALSSVQTQGGLLITCIVRDLTDRPIPGKPDED
jgi:PAS domain S-box-containing protein